MTQNTAKTVYFAGELFSAKHLVGNALLADAIHNVSSGAYQCILPQNREQRDTPSRSIRNQDLYIAATVDLGLFHFDGPDLDPGTVVEYMVAKFLDIPSVLLRTDFRRAGDDDLRPWNLMLGFYPRTEIIILDSVVEYTAPLKAGSVHDDDWIAAAKAGVQAAQQLTNSIASKVVAAFDKVITEKPVLQPAQREVVYDWIRNFAGADFDKRLSATELKQVLQRKVDRGLL